MATTYTWEITGLKRRTVGALSDAVVKVTWIRKGVDDSSNTAIIGGACLFDEPSTEGFTAYASLTETEVLGWITDIISDNEIAAMKSNIDRNIAELVNTPTEITSSFPWS